MTQEAQTPVVEISFEGVAEYLHDLPEPAMAAFREFAMAMADVDASLPNIMVLPPLESTNDPS